ncbi:MAG: YlbF family regulator [Oscillospiraceae bacterium]|nr:YlbF family regulator [Oscillospiraceae bacterium]
MDLEKLTRELGKAIQQDERYLRFEQARIANEQDTALNELMSRIQLIQMSYQHEASKDEPNEGKMKAYDEEFRGVYTEIMQNKNMQNYEAARKDIDDMMNYLTGILALCVNGEDPDTCDPTAHSCGGECSECGGGCGHDH